MVRGVERFQWLASQQLARSPTTLRRLGYLKGHKRLPRLRNPRTFTEKVQWRILYDRRELIRLTGDKMWMKAYTTKLNIHGLKIPVPIWAGTDLTDLREFELPPRWVLKPNNRSGLVHIGTGAPSVSGLTTLTADWLTPFEWEHRREWAYRDARQMFIIEPFIGESSVPRDLKFYVFSGDVALIQIDSGRFVHHERSFYSSDWTYLPISHGYPLAPPVQAPTSLGELLRIAGEIGAEFDFVRVDLYDTPSGIHFGELTPYPAGGVKPFQPRSFDFELGQRWRLPALEGSPN